MKFTRSEPCTGCPFLKKFKRGFTMERLKELASNAMPCHLTADNDEETGDYSIGKHSVACAGALIFNEKREIYTQTMQIAERLGLYKKKKLNMGADVR